MLKQYQHVVGGAFRVVDVCVIGVAWVAAFYLRFAVPIIPIREGVPPFANYLGLLPLVMALWTLVFSSLNVYRSRRMLRRTHEAHLILKAHGVAMLFFIALSYLFYDLISNDPQSRVSRVVMLYFAVLGGFALVIFRLGLRNLLREARRKGHNLRHILIVGEGPSVELLVARLEKFPELGLRIKGIVTHETSKRKTLHGKPVVGHFGEVARLANEGVDQLLIVLPRAQYGDIDRILGSLKNETVDIRLIPDVHEYVTLGCEIEEFEGLPIVNLNDSPLDGWGSILKRATDLALSSLGLVLTGPLLLLIAGLVRLSSKGAILYRQERMGLDGRTFQMLKFRSMKSGAEEENGAVWAQRSDPRRTKIGAFIRATSLDELPQLWNVLKGEMSLVGPRPERPIFVKKFRDEIPHYMLRHKVKAGITGWAQVNGWRGNTSLDRRIEFDLYYIRNWSYVLDLKILALTLLKGFINRNAY